MKVYRTDQIRNVVLLGHGGAGKTTLAEAMAYLAGITNRLGKVTDGNTVSDYDKEEIKRKFSISTSVIPLEWNDNKINILDTPGFFDFVGEAEEAAYAADAAIIVVSGKSGVEVGTQKAWDLCEKYKLPRMFFVTDMDIDDVSYRKVVEELQELYGKKVAPLHMPIRENGKYIGYANVVKNVARRYTDKDKKVECPVPDYAEEYLEDYRNELLEAVAETSEEFMERFFDGEEFSVEEIMGALRINVADGSIIPVCMGAPVNIQGVRILLNDIISYFPNPSMRKKTALDRNNSSKFEANYNFQKPKTAQVWKTIVDPFLGKYSLIKVCSGVIKSADTLYDVTQDKEMKIGKLYILCGSKSEEVAEVHAGDICALAKLNDVKTGDTFALKNNVVDYGPVAISKPYTVKKYSPKDKKDVDKVATGLGRLAQEDQTLKLTIDAANHQSLIAGIGDQHLDVVASKLKDRYGVDIVLEKPLVSFRETIRKKSDVQGKYKKQSGGHGQYGDVRMRFEPSGDMETPYIFEEEVVGGAVPKNFFPAVEKGLDECTKSGPLAAYPVVGVKAVLYDGSYHPVDSSEMAFKSATRLAFKKGFMEAGPVLLEPIVSIKVTAPDKFTGDVMGDLNKRRGRILGMNPDHKGNTILEGEVPELELYGYSNNLRSMTGGAGTFEYEFVRYEQAPSDVQEKEIQARADQVNQGDD